MSDMLSGMRHRIVIMVDTRVLIHVIVVGVALRIVKIEEIRPRIALDLLFLAPLLFEVFIVSF